MLGAFPQQRAVTTSGSPLTVARPSRLSTGFLNKNSQGLREALRVPPIYCPRRTNGPLRARDLPGNLLCGLIDPQSRERGMAQVPVTRPFRKTNLHN